MQEEKITSNHFNQIFANTEDLQPLVFRLLTWHNNLGNEKSCVPLYNKM